MINRIWVVRGARDGEGDVIADTVFENEHEAYHFAMTYKSGWQRSCVGTVHVFEEVMYT